jgi:hypothetical protein
MTDVPPARTTLNKKKKKKKKGGLGEGNERAFDGSPKE